MQAVKTGDGNAAAKAIKKQKEMSQQAAVEQGDLFGDDESDDGDYDEEALARDEADARCAITESVAYHAVSLFLPS